MAWNKDDLIKSVGAGDECNKGIDNNSQILAWKTVGIIVPFANIIEMMKEVGIAGPGSSGSEFSLGHIAFHMLGRMSSK